MEFPDCMGYASSLSERANGRVRKRTTVPFCHLLSHRRRASHATIRVNRNLWVTHLLGKLQLVILILDF